ncbi:ACP S-malonyltransferase [Chloroflexota bacterium]
MPELTKVAYIFPGQASQKVGMGQDLYDRYDSARNVFNQADEALGFSLSRMCFEGPEDELNQTVNTQPALVTVSLAYLVAAQSAGDGKVLPAASYVAGHSLGEYTALAATGVLDVPETVRLARERGRLMYETGLQRIGSMLAVIGLDEIALRDICSETDTGIANFNCPGQLVISGVKDNLDKAATLAQEKGAKRVVPLAVSGAFHSPLMQAAVDGLSQAIDSSSFKEPSVPIIANTTAQPMTSVQEVKEELIRQMCNAVQWQRSVEYMIDNCVSTFIEIGPGRVLSGLIRRINSDVTTLNIGDAAAVEKLAAE